MSISVGQTQSIDSQANQQAKPLNGASDWQSMLAEFNVVSYTYWRMAKNESMQIVHGSAEIDASFRARSSELAEVAIRTGQSHSCVLASPVPAILIAEPITAVGSDCLCVGFHCELNELNEKAIAQRFAIVAKVASTITATPQSDSVQVAQLPSLPTWTELASFTKQKLLVLMAHSKSRAKVYIGTLLAIAAVCLLPWPHSISCKVVCEPVLRRYVAAPFDARLLLSHVVIGQQIKQGDLLATLDGGELRSRLASIRAKLAQAEQRELAALSTGDHSKSEFERLEVEHLRREAELLESRQTNLEIRSPIDGVVVIGDLERTEGAPLSVGDNLFEIASLTQLIAEVAVPEQDILFVKDKMPVSIVMDAIPGSKFESKIQRIHLRNEIRDNASVFIAEAELPNDANLLRPGMNAKATIDAGYRAIGWQLFRRPYNAARQWIGW